MRRAHRVETLPQELAEFLQRAFNETTWSRSSRSETRKPCIACVAVRSHPWIEKGGFLASTSCATGKRWKPFGPTSASVRPAHVRLRSARSVIIRIQCTHSPRTPIHRAGSLTTPHFARRGGP